MTDNTYSPVFFTVRRPVALAILILFLLGLCVTISFGSCRYLPAAPQSSSGVTVSWDANIEDDLAGYRVYWGSSESYESVEDVGNITSYRITDLPESEVFFAVTAYDFADNESLFSEEVSFTPQQKLPPIPEVQLAGTDTTEIDTIIIRFADEFKFVVGIPPVYSDGSGMPAGSVDSAEIHITDITNGWSGAVAKDTIMVSRGDVATHQIVFEKDHQYNINARLWLDGSSGAWPQPPTEFFNVKETVILEKEFWEILFRADEN